MKLNYDNYYFKMSLYGFIVCCLVVGIDILFEIFILSGNNMVDKIQWSTIYFGIYCLISMFLLKSPYLIIKDGKFRLKVFYVLKSVKFHSNDINAVVAVEKKNNIFFPLNSYMKVILKNGKSYKIYSAYLNSEDWKNLFGYFFYRRDFYHHRLS